MYLMPDAFVNIYVILYDIWHLKQIFKKQILWKATKTYCDLFYSKNYLLTKFFYSNYSPINGNKKLDFLFRSFVSQR